MSGVEIGIASVILIIVFIYAGLYIPVTLGLISFFGVWIIRDNFDVAVSLLSLSVADTVASQVFATIPLFALMGLVVSKAGMGKDVYDVAHALFHRLRGGLGVATVAANAVFASITGSSIASATVFSKISVPEMRRFRYTNSFAVGVVAGSSVLGMLIPPSAMLIIYAIVSEESVGRMFIAGIIPGILLSVAFIAMIILLSYLAPGFIGGQPVAGEAASGKDPKYDLSAVDYLVKLLPVAVLVIAVLGGIYGGVVTPIEAGASGSLIALVIAFFKRRFSWGSLWEVLVETGRISAIVLFLIISASMYSRMLGVAGLPALFEQWLNGLDLSLGQMMALYVILMLFLGTIIDTASIILIVVPLFLPAVEALGLDLVWFGIVTVIGAEIGLLTPPLGLSCFAIKSALDLDDITLRDIFVGAFPFALTMLLVLVLIINFPILSLALL